MTAEISQLSYEEARDELVQVVTTLERGGITLEESLKLWERGEALANRCESWLVSAKERLEGTTSDSDSNSAQTSTDSSAEKTQSTSDFPDPTEQSETFSEDAF